MRASELIAVGGSGELLLDQQRPQEAIEKFDEAIAVEMTKSALPFPSLYVLGAHACSGRQRMSFL